MCATNNPFQETGESRSPSVHNLSTPILSAISDIAGTDDSTYHKDAGDHTGNDSTSTDSTGEGTQNSPNALQVLNEMRMKYVNNVLIGHLNINSLANKFDALSEIVKDKLDILVISETKLDDSFPENQFLIEGFKKPYRFHRNSNGGGVMLYIRKDIHCKELKNNFSKNIEAIFVEINLRKSKMLLVGTYHSKHPLYGTNDIEYFEQIGLSLDVYSNYEKFLLAGDFNVQETDAPLQEFLDEFGAKNLVKDKTCFKSPENPSCIDLFLTNSCRSFQKTTTVSTTFRFP